MKRFVLNLLLVLMVLMPVWFALQFVIVAVVTHANPDPKWPSSILFLYLVFGPKCLAGGVIHGLILQRIPDDWLPKWQRLAAMSSAVVIPLTFVAFARGDLARLGTIGMQGTFGVALVVYGSLVRLPHPDLHHAR